MADRGFILIADITGYTVYLNESELEHARGTLTDLLELLVEHTRPPMVISRLEGDAVLSYAFEDGFVSGQTFLERVEDTYVAFRKAIELMILNNTCKCNACANVSTLDLKFFVHFGRFALQRIDTYDELLGTDVNLIHRLLKNSVTADTGIRAYVLCTAAAVKVLGIDPGTGPVLPSEQSINDGSYTPLSRPLFMYPSEKALRKPQVKAFMEFVLENADSIAEAAQIVPASQEDIDKSKAALAG